MRISRFLFLLALILLSKPATSQRLFYAKAGPTFTSYTLKNTFGNKIEKKSPAGFTAGLGLVLPVAKVQWLSVQPEIDFMQKKFAYDTQAFIPEEIVPGGAVIQMPSSARTLHYIEVPLLVRAGKTFGKSDGYVVLGPSVGYALSGNWKHGNLRGEQNFSNCARMEVSAQMGAGVGFPAGPGTFLLDARFSLGLTDFIKPSTQTIFMNGKNEQDGSLELPLPGDQRSRVLSFTVGYALPLGF